MTRLLIVAYRAWVITAAWHVREAFGQQR